MDPADETSAWPSPWAEVHDEGESLLVVARLPGAGDGTPVTVVREDALLLAMHTAECRYGLSVPLPCKVEAVPACRVYTNGVLCLWLTKRREPL